ncbi:collagen alpha-1(XIII) chain-like [Heterodontus francisci]|uniref:collagen alpha-1(XIII) chain-like n=1 Tax=Heterodontus francisci TaxID=7792 RepID=UPI00355C1EEC
MEGSPKSTREATRPAFRRSCKASQISKCWRHCPDISGVVCCLLSIVSLGFCILVHYRTSDLQTRVSYLEEERQVLSAWLSMDQMEPTIFNRVDQLVDEKLKARLPKMRTHRSVPGGCMCPPGCSWDQKEAIQPLDSVLPFKYIMPDLSSIPSTCLGTISLNTLA